MVGKIQAEPKSLANLVHLLESIKRSLDHQSEVENLRGDRFNIFSILRVESDENRLHSAFIAELLDAKGSHGMGAHFLARFLGVLKAAGVKRELDITTTRVAVEKDIGRISADGTQGGRIDILLEDGAGSSVSIENKIFASDQNNQVVRYTRYNSMRNEVVYLTLLGQEPDDKSKGQLVAGEDFYWRSTGLFRIVSEMLLKRNMPISYPLTSSIRQRIKRSTRISG